MRFTRPALTLLVLASSAGAQARTTDGPRQAARPAAPTSHSAAERIVFTLEDDWARAVVRRDGATFRRLLAPGFVYTENDRVMTGADVIRDVTSGTDTVTAASNEDMRAHPFGTTIVITGILTMRGRGADGPFDRRYRFTDTWVRRGRSWQIVAAQDYLMPPATR